MKILLGQSYFQQFDEKLRAAHQPYPPLGTLYAASLLRRHGHEPVLFDAMLAESELEWLSALDTIRPDLAVLYEDNFNYLSKMCLARMRQAAFQMIGDAHKRGIPVIAAGADASDHWRKYLEVGASYVLIGEGDITLAEMVNQLEKRSGAAPESIDGLAFLRPDGSGVRTTPRAPLRNLDDLPFPAWDLVDIERYRRIWSRHHGYFSMNVATTRGCPYHCNWCAKPIWGQRYNVRTPKNVAAEIAWLQEKYRPDHLSFVDDIFGLQPGWLNEFAARIEAGGTRVPFKCLSRVDLLLRPGEIEALRRAGARTVWVGAESGSQAILDAMEKGTKIDQIFQVTSRLRSAGIGVGFFLQFGYPGETQADIEATRRMVMELLPDDIGISVSYPLPGTKFYLRVKDQLGEKRHWQDSNDLAMLYHGSQSTAYYRQLHRTLHTEYRFRKAWRDIKIIAQTRPRIGLKRLARIGRAIMQGGSLPFERLRLRNLAGQPGGNIRLDGRGLNQAEAATPTAQMDR